MADLADAHKRILSARKDLRGRSATRKAKALHEVIERIVVHHETAQRAGEPVALLAWVRIEPKTAAPEGGTAERPEESPTRRGSTGPPA